MPDTNRLYSTSLYSPMIINRELMGDCIFTSEQLTEAMTNPRLRSIQILPGQMTIRRLTVKFRYGMRTAPRGFKA